MQSIKYFDVEIQDKNRIFHVYRASSLDHPQNNSVMFIKEGMIAHWKVFLQVSNCVIFWPQTHLVPEEIIDLHCVTPCENPRLEYCLFFQKHGIRYLPSQAPFNIVNGAIICESAKLGKNVVVMPGAYIGPQVQIGDNCYIGAGAKLVGFIECHSNVVIRENAVLGADGRTTDRDKSGKIITMPQFGGIVIEDHVEIGAGTVIERGAIDNTVISSGSKIDCCCLVGHNSFIGKDCVLVAGTVFLGSVCAQDKSYFAGNVIVRNQISVGKGSLVGMGSVVTKSIDADKIVFGNPAHVKSDKK